MAVSGLTKIRNKNMLAIFQEIILSNGILRSEISERTGISLMTVGKIMDVFLKRNIIFEKEYHTTTAGRKPALALPNVDVWWSCVFSLTDAVTISVLSLDLRLIYVAKFDVVDNNWEASLQEAIEDVQIYIKDNNLDLNTLMGVGVSAPAPYNNELDRVACPNRPNLENLRLRKILSEKFGADIYIDEDVKLAAIASLDAFAEYRDTNIFYMYIGIGVGGVLLQHGEIYRGEDNYAGDIGQVILSEGVTVEDYLSWETLSKRFAAHGVESDEDEITDEDDPVLLAIVDDYADKLALSVYNAVCMYSPKAVIIDGKYSPLGQPFYRAFRKYYDNYFIRYERVKPVVHFSFGGMDGAVLGLGYQLRKHWLLKDNQK